MISVAIAIATAGIIVGAVASTGLSNNLIVIVEAISGGNIITLLLLTAVLCIILGMGLPTTANYLVVAALMAQVVVEVKCLRVYFSFNCYSFICFLLWTNGRCDSASGPRFLCCSCNIKSRSYKNWCSSFWYSLRTGILPIVFIFNPELLLIGVENIWHGLTVVITSLVAILIFTAATQGWFINKLKWYEIIIFLILSMSLFRPGYILDKFYLKLRSRLYRQKN